MNAAVEINNNIDGVINNVIQQELKHKGKKPLSETEFGFRC